VALTAELAGLIGDWEEGSLAQGEFFDRMMKYLSPLAPDAKDAALAALSAHANEDIRQAAADCGSFLRNAALSRDLDHVCRHSPLRPGVRLALFGGYDYHSSGGNPYWLNGRECYRATFIGFAPRGEDLSPAGLVEFDEVIDLPGHKGRYGALLTSYGLDFVAWTQPEADAVVVYVTERPPEDFSVFRYDGRASPDPIETHATYRIEEGV
jgi:hypothetical protein